MCSVEVGAVKRELIWRRYQLFSAAGDEITKETEGFANLFAQQHFMVDISACTNILLAN